MSGEVPAPTRIRLQYKSLDKNAMCVCLCEDQIETLRLKNIKKNVYGCWRLSLGVAQHQVALRSTSLD